MLKIKQKGNFDKTTKFFKGVITSDYIIILEKYAIEGVNALKSVTPVNTGKTSNSWSYEINTTRGGTSISWINSNIVDGVPIAIVLQYGHATKNGGFVKGIDYINPVIKPIFDKISNNIWKEVTRL